MSETPTPRRQSGGTRPRGAASARALPVADPDPLPPAPELIFDPQAPEAAGRQLVRNASLWAILVGIDDYDDPSIPALQYCGRDAQALADFFANANSVGYRSTVIRLLIDGMDRRRLPTRANIMRAVRELAQTADKEDVILLGFFGHGVTAGGKSHLLACDSVDAQQAETGVELRWVLQTLQDSRAQVKLMIFDACHSGELIGRAPALHLSEDFIRTFQGAVKSRGWAVLSACNRDQRSYEDEESEHGLFTHCLLEGLRGAADKDRDGIITVRDLYSYARDRTTKLAFARSLQQSPELAWNLTEGDDIVLVSPPLEQPAAASVPIVAVMGVKGGVGKGTFVNCAAQLFADNGPDTDVAILDFDLENDGAALAAEHRYSSLTHPVKTVFDHIARVSKGFEAHEGRAPEKLWNITPGYLVDRRRGRIWLLPSRDSGRGLSGFDVVANIPPETRDRDLLDLTWQMIDRVRRQLPKVSCIFIDCGASRDNPLYLAAFAAADYRFIIATPDPAYRKAIDQIQTFFYRRYRDGLPDEKSGIYTVVNRVTSEAEKGRALRELRPIGCIGRDPVFEETAHALGGVDYDLGFGTVFSDVQQCLRKALQDDDVKLLPDEKTVRIKPWWARLFEEGIAERVLASAAFRARIFIAWAAIAIFASGLGLTSYLAWQTWKDDTAAVQQAVATTSTDRAAPSQRKESATTGLESVPPLASLVLLGIGTAYCRRQMKKRSLLQTIASGRGEDLLDALMRRKDGWQFRWLRELVQQEETSKERSTTWQSKLREGASEPASSDPIPSS